VEFPPLRRHIEDLNELVPLFLARLNPHGPSFCDACAHLVDKYDEVTGQATGAGVRPLLLLIPGGGSR
jgi:hypothetical protein